MLYNIISFVEMSECVLSAEKRTTLHLNKLDKNLPASLCLLTSYLLLSINVHSFKIWSIAKQFGCLCPSYSHFYATNGLKLIEFALTTLEIFHIRVIDP